MQPSRATYHTTISKCSRSFPVNIYLLKFNNSNTRKRYEICPKFTIKHQYDAIEICPAAMEESPKRFPLNTFFSVTVIFQKAKLKLLSVRKPNLRKFSSPRPKILLLSTYLIPSLQNYQKEKKLKLPRISKTVK